MLSRAILLIGKMGIVEKIWLKNYPKGVPAEINPDAYQSIVEIFQESCRLYKNLPAFYNLGVTLHLKSLKSMPWQRPLIFSKS